jgi:signal transduction histidine kinase/ABC-type uncharacterized transport system substrate-binding protein
MQRIKVIIFSFLLFFLFLTPHEVYSKGEIKTIVVFFSLNASLPAYQNILEGFRTSFKEDYKEPCNLLIEYLDIGRSEDNSYARSIIETYNEKFTDTKIDLLITVGPGIYPVLKKFGLRILDGTPTISIENSGFSKRPESDRTNKNLLEITLRYKINKTIQNAFRLFPKNKNVYVISGCSAVDHYYTTLFMEQAAGFKTGYNFVYVSDISLDSTLHLVKKLPGNCIVFVPIFLSDNKNIPYSTPEALSIISTCSYAPVFPIFDSFIKRKGVIGGCVFSYRKLGEEVGGAARKILNGEYPGNIVINENSFYQHIYDWQMLKKWKLADSPLIPANSICFNKPFDFFATYKWYFLGLLLFLMLETVLIIYLFRLNKMQKDVAMQKEETEQLYRVLVREDRLARMSELTASLSHELNQPLTAILYSAQAGMRFLESGRLDDKQAAEIFENIIEDAKRSGGLISSVRSLMKLETREMEKVNLNALVEESLTIFHSEADQLRITITQNLLDKPVFVFGDKIQIQQVLLNFMSNAALAMETGDPDHKIMTILQLLDKHTVTISVRDTGPGISPELTENLFKPFVTSRISGFGIGLALCKSIIEKHNGKIRAENLAHGGAEFCFTLKIVQDAT